jgi:hypothetical protein
MNAPDCFYTHGEILRAAYQVLAENGLHEWHVRITKLRNALGNCDPVSKIIRLNERMYGSRLCEDPDGISKDFMMNLIWHEVAHALTPLRNFSTIQARAASQAVPYVKNGIVRWRRKRGSSESERAAHHNLAWARNAVRLGCTPGLASCPREAAMLRRALREHSQVQA